YRAEIGKAGTEPQHVYTILDRGVQRDRLFDREAGSLRQGGQIRSRLAAIEDRDRDGAPPVGRIHREVARQSSERLPERREVRLRRIDVDRGRSVRRDDFDDAGNSRTLDGPGETHRPVVDGKV